MQNSIRPMPPFDMVVSLVLLFFLLVIPTCASSYSIDHQGTALLSWKNGFNLTDSSGFPTFFNSWNPSDPSPCNWSGIHCSPGGLVTEITIQDLHVPAGVPTGLQVLSSLRSLVISYANLTGPLVTELGRYTSLEVLDLSGNKLAGPIPKEIGKLKNLQSLILNTNSLEGSIPEEIAECGALQEILIFDNQLSGSIPKSLGRLQNLKVFRGGGNVDIDGELPEELGNCTNLETLGLAETKISGSIPASFGKLKNLQTLAIYTAMLSGSIPKELGLCSELVNLYLYENELSGSVPIELGMLKKLEKLLLWQNQIEGDIPSQLSNCSSLNVIDLSLNKITGRIPPSLGALQNLNELQLSVNNISGSIPRELGKCTSLTQMQLDNNQIRGPIPSELGNLTALNVLFLWQNHLQGAIPNSLGGCRDLQALDLSHNQLSGPIPNSIFGLKNLTKILLLSNLLTGMIPAEVGGCGALLRLRLSNNNLVGHIPKTIGLLENLIFLDLAENNLSGQVPEEIGGCSQLQLLDLHSNMLTGEVPESLGEISGLQIIDISYNKLSGRIPNSLGKLSALNKLVLTSNGLSGSVPAELTRCMTLQFFDLSNNHLSGPIPQDIGRMQGLDDSLNFSYNALAGILPPGFAELTKLVFLDLSHNLLFGDLQPVSGLENLVSLNVSFNNFSGIVPDTPLFRSMPASNWEGNGKLSRTNTNKMEHGDGQKSTKIIMSVLFGVTAALFVLGIWVAMAAARARRVGDEEASDSDCAWPWQMTSFQKLSFCIDDIVDSLVERNVIGKGCSGMVYKADIGNGDVIAVKKLWTQRSDERGECVKHRDSFSAEVRTLGSIRHRNIVRLLGYCTNRRSKLLLYDYMPNGSLAGILHEKRWMLDWEIRYNIVLGAAQGLAYLHHDCKPPILHRDVKANNILLGTQCEPYLADFGLAKLVDGSDYTRSSTTIAGSYGYIAPEYGYTMKITEKSDVYSFGVVVLEVITGKEPIDPTVPDGHHLVDWVRRTVQGGANVAVDQVIDPRLQGRPEEQVQEMLQVLGVALLCVNNNPEERPSMKDVAALLHEIKHDNPLDNPKLINTVSTSGVISATSSDNTFNNASPKAPLRAFSVISSASTSARHSYSFHSSS